MMTLLILQVAAFTLLNVGIVSLGELLDEKENRVRCVVAALACFAVSSLIYYYTEPQISIWVHPDKH